MSGLSLVSTHQASYHRVMRMLQTRAFAAVDIGLSKISCVIVRPDAALLHGALQDREVAPLAALPVIGVAMGESAGLDDSGEITDSALLGKAIAATLREAKQQAQITPRDALFTLPGGDPRMLLSEARSRLEIPYVDDAIVARLFSQCRPDLALSLRRPIHVEPLEFMLGNGQTVADPRGSYVDGLTARWAVVSISEGCASAIETAAQRAGLRVAGIASAPIAAGLATLTDDEMTLGASVIDMGASGTSVASFAGGRIAGIGRVPLGGDVLTRDLAQALNCTAAQAELRKLPGGSEGPIQGMADTADSAAQLIGGVLRPRLEEIFELAQPMLNGGPERPVVLTGGGSQLRGLVDLASAKLGRSARIGRPFRAYGLPGSASGPRFSATLGLLSHTARLHAEPMQKLLAGMDRSGSMLPSMTAWIRDNW